jgi:hypothetical protein
MRNVPANIDGNGTREVVDDPDNGASSLSAVTLLTGTAGIGSSLFGLKTLLDSAVGLGLLDMNTDLTVVT